MLRLAASRLRSVADAEDAVQETFLYLLEHGVTFRDAGHEKAWLIRTTLHRARNIAKRAAARDLPLEEAEIPGASDGGEHELLEAVRALPEKYGAVIHLHYYEGYSIREIASVLGLPSATVGTRLARARAMLRQTLEEE